MNPEYKTLINDLLAAIEKAVQTGQVHPGEIHGALAQVTHAMHKQFTDVMFKRVDVPAKELPSNVQPIAPAGN